MIKNVKFSNVYMTVFVIIILIIIAPIKLTVFLVTNWHKTCKYYLISKDGNLTRIRQVVTSAMKPEHLWEGPHWRYSEEKAGKVQHCCTYNRVWNLSVASRETMTTPVEVEHSGLLVETWSAKQQHYQLSVLRFKLLENTLKSRYNKL